MMTQPDDDPLDGLFAQARAQRPDVPDALMARVLADADRQQARRQPPRAPRPTSLWDGLFDMLGGWPALGGMAAATVAGLWLGVAPPAPVADVAAALMGETVQFSLITDDLFDDMEGLIDG